MPLFICRWKAGYQTWSWTNQSLQFSTITLVIMLIIISLLNCALNGWFALVCSHSQCYSQSVPLRESRKRLRDGSTQPRSRAIYGPFLFSFPGLKMVSVTSSTIIFKLNRTFNVKNNDSVPMYTTWKSIDESSWVYLIYREWSGDHWASTWLL